MYSRLGASIINLFLGIILAYMIPDMYETVIRAIVVICGQFKEFVALGIILIMAIRYGIVLCYNAKRYDLLKKGDLNYSKAWFYVTLLIPLYVPTALRIIYIK